MTPDELAGAFQRLGGRLYRYALAILSSPQDAEEVVQDLFMALAESEAGWRPADLDGYLMRAARNAAIKRLGRARRRAALLREGAAVLVPRDGGDPALAELASRASRALEALPTAQREAVALHLFEGLGFPEIGELTGAPADTAASRYRYGIGRLKEILGDEHP